MSFNRGRKGIKVCPEKIIAFPFLKKIFKLLKSLETPYVAPL
jgi:hypothetical protein